MSSSSHNRIRTGVRVVPLMVVAAAMLVGCQGSSDRLGVEGQVTFDGQPLPEGKISFLPLPGTASPTAGATIRQGRYVIDSATGLKPGEFQVAIKALRSTGKQIKDDLSEDMIDQMEPYIPERYNTNTELRAQVKPGEKNTVDFNLTSH